MTSRNYSTSLWNKDHTLHHTSAELKSSLKVGTVVRKLTLFEVVLVDFSFGPATERHFAASELSWQRMTGSLTGSPFHNNDVIHRLRSLHASLPTREEKVPACCKGIVLLHVYASG